MSVILIVDDNEKNRYLLRTMLSASSYEVIEASNGAEALESARRSHPDLIISDILMPQMDGFALCRECKSDEKLRNIPFVFYTATYTDPRDEALGLKLGAARFLVKPIENEEFVSIMRDVLKAYANNQLTAPLPPIEDKTVFYRLYNEALIRKLEGKMLELKSLNLSLTKSKERFRALTEATAEGIVFHHQGVIEDVNPPLLSMFGYENASEIIGHKLLEFVAPESRDIVMKQVQSSSTQPYEAMGLRKDGTTFPVEACARLYEYQGRTVRVASIRDITTRKQAEETYSRIIHTAMDGFWLTDNEGRFLDVNDAYCQMIGYSREELLKMGVRDVEAAESPEETAKHIQKIKELGYDRFETLHRHKDGRLITIEISVNYFKGDEGQGFVFLRDITARKKAEEEARLLQTISIGVGEAEDLNSAVEFVLRRVCEATGWIMGEAWLPSRDNTRMECYPVYYNSVQELEEFRRISRDFVFKPGEGLPGTVWLTKKPLWIVEAGAEADFLRREAALKAGLKAVAGFPVLGHNQVVMVMVFFLFEPRPKDQHMVELIAAVAAQIGLLIERKRAEEERERLQAQLIQAQKMESIGRLAGGVAHDFNNMLSAILGYTELSLDKTDPANPIHNYLKEILNATKRSADITRQLLAFARRQTISPKALDLNETVESMLKMLRRLIGENIDLVWRPGSGIWPVILDPSQIDQILANLCVNARDAIVDVGKIIIETDNATIDAAYCVEHANFVQGDFVLLSVSDDGCGMDKEMLSHVFEPFFTTKGVSKGTGLGLATVYGIVNQNNGFINVYSEPGRGTTFKIYLPRHKGKADKAITECIAEIPQGNGETVLLVEDDQSIMEMSKTMLINLNYHVLAANTPSNAMHLASEHKSNINLLVTDVIMPEMNGRDLADRLHSINPDIKTLFMSGYPADIISNKGVLDEGVNFIQKPFSQKDLAVKVCKALGRK